MSFPVEVSVLMPFRNAEVEALSRAVDSIKNQTFSHWELILVNNNDKEKTPDALWAKTQSDNDERIRLIHESETGIAYALNTGLSYCSGKYIARMDADDVSIPDRLQLQSHFLNEHDDIGLVSGLVSFISEIENAGGYEKFVEQINAWKTSEEIYMHRFVESPLAHPSVMFRKSIVEIYGGYSLEAVPEDYELWLRWMQHGVKMYKLPEKVLEWNDHAQRLSRNHDHYSREAFDKVRYQYLSQWLKLKLKNLPPIYVCGGGKFARVKIRLLESLSIPIKGIIDFKERKISEKYFLSYEDIPPPGNLFIISLISNRGKFSEVRDFLEVRGYINGKDFILAG